VILLRGRCRVSKAEILFFPKMWLVEPSGPDGHLLRNRQVVSKLMKDLEKERG
jgi:hypothetical protein